MGSQYASAHAFQKIRQLLAAGAIGELNSVEAWLDRNTAMGAWQYSIPPDASPQNIDWDRFLGTAPKRPFEPIRLFRWRNYRDYGTAVAGDLYVHLFTGLHTATGALGPRQIFSTGGLRYWIDGRDVPDTQIRIIDYDKSEHHPRFQFMLRVNFKSLESRRGFRLPLHRQRGHDHDRRHQRHAESRAARERAGPDRRHIFQKDPGRIHAHVP